MENVAQHIGAPTVRGARSRAAQSPAVSQRVTTKLLKVAQACGIERYEIIFEMSGQVRLSVGGECSVRPGATRENEFDRAFA